MATSSDVKAGLNEISAKILSLRQSLIYAKGMISEKETELGKIEGDYADVITTINGYGTSNAFEAVSKAELAKMTTEFITLKDDASLAVADLATRTEF